MVAPDLPIGDRIRHYRQTRGGRRQDVIAGLVGITPDYLGQIERGLKTPTIQVLHAIAQELGVPTAALLAEAPVLASTPRDSTEPAIAQALMGYGPPRSAEPVPTPALRERVEQAWRSWQTSRTRFTDAATVLPALIADTEHAVRAHRADPGQHRNALRISADLYFLLRSYLRRTGRVDLSLMAADRAVRAAEDADDPLRIAAAQWNLGHVLLAADEPDGAEQVVLRAAEAIKQEAIEEEKRAAMAGALQLVSVVAAARRRDWWTARDRLNKARTTAQHVGEGNVAWTVYGPVNVELHRVSIEMEAGEAGEALRMADAVDTSGLPSMEREFTFLLEVARCYDLRREDSAVLLHLLELEQMAPEDLARQPMARDMLLGLIRRARAMHARQAEALAGRVGVL
ncbi:helix-turn-helix domain-containing protein [Kitasatospora sp. NBC_01287]|uniref:helix-turn-helix domain-containing protein n=1 Tax=Kitasatospora sp. NBC_01287 TaxID=2903573 RepID=UPI00225C148B|nr:helix-turn-helix transcriptional regulator [Kitasatospora sp. NBC_01287]MCX4750881.1 helix-turn-helix domain-containing protein [Kitasatospora sp. NBC_01287]MCX4751840.1 helix-turn-helix domain-containing protein [Kitasatospora sp. NBC_01287]